jgi:hypothetical protein
MDMINAYKYFGTKPEGMRSLGRPNHRYDDNTKTDLHKIGCEGVYGLIWLTIGSSGRF